MVLQTSLKQTEPLVTWEKLPEDFVLPDDPVENILQPALAAALTDALGAANCMEPTEEGRYWIPELELFLGIWYGTRLELTINWLRWWDEAGNMLLWSAEQAEQERQRAEAAIAQAQVEQQRNESLAAKLRELGIDPDTLQ